ncbi:MAG: ribonuclease Y [Candidatus Latescibacteria bacterium]|nr:ribonuclease Y [Candidatus Latescibacterota bacterium]NIM21523.1 ribonuclease Y [Candidatus Latescibacterota bacterium]NIM65694.1 ribonuclease Y [Candidatus Latescibacterota bacterium]NIO02076.1 ribonuclease Y [Candidatus Latescibacterota bacterium]NIO28888.1 ribonuclease Y [Candidatus Latescibacterota bacterium]
MTGYWIYIVIGAAATFIGFLVGMLINRRVAAGRLMNARQLAESIIADAQKEAENVRKGAGVEAKDAYFQMKQRFEDETKMTQEKLKKLEAKLMDKDSNLARKLDLLEKKDASLNEKSAAIESKQRTLDSKIADASRIIAEQNVRLEKIAGMNKEEAKRILMKNLESEARMEASKRIKEIRDEAEFTAQKEATKIITMAIQRYAAEHSVETTVSVVDLPSDEMKGRIIGREGRNIRAFETATGVDVIIDDTPEAVILSGFDPVRREVARLSLQKLVQDGRIHPGRIEEIVEKTRTEIEEKVREIGEQTCIDLGIHGINPELLKLLGRLRYRTSYGQNCLSHSIEVAYLSGMIAAELKLDQPLAKRMGLLHDIGKAVAHEVEGTHTEIGAEMAKRHGEGDIVVNAIGGHHGDVEALSLYTPIVGAADAISGARPGARRETLETYVKRLTKLEEIADGFDGVEKAYAIQAGREIRILVSHKRLDDDAAANLAHEVSRKVEKELEYPGQIKVVVIREMRAVGYAK